MTLPIAGNPISLTDLRNEMGGLAPLSLSDYSNIIPGTAGSNLVPISLSEFYNKKFYVVEEITSDTIWTPKNMNATNVHIVVVGAGGSGGCAWPRSGSIDGVGASSGGAAGGVAYSIIAGEEITSAQIVIGVGGAGVSVSSEGAYSPGNDGTYSQFLCSLVNMIGAGGEGGAAITVTDSGATTGNTAISVGGTAHGGNAGNFKGGDGGATNIRVYGVGKVASGGGAISFSIDHNSLSNSNTANGMISTGGIKVSDYPTFPDILSDYIIGRGQTPILSSSIFSYDASDGNILDAISTTGDVIFGSGSGGCSHEASPGSGKGGDGVVYIIYEII